MAPVTGDSKWSPMLPPPMTGPLGIQQLRPSAFPAAPFGAGASGENVYRPADMNLYSSGRAPLVVPVRAKRFMAGDQQLPVGHPIEHGQLVAVVTNKEKNREVDIFVSGYPTQRRQFKTASRVDNEDDMVAAIAKEAPDRNGGPFTGVQLKTITGLGYGAVATITITGNKVAEILFTTAGHGYKTGDVVEFEAKDIGGGAKNFTIKLDGNSFQPYASGADVSYWAIVSETVYVGRDAPTHISLSVEGTELMKFGDDTIKHPLSGGYPKQSGKQPADQKEGEFLYNAIGIDQKTLCTGGVRFALVTFPFQARKFGDPSTAINIAPYTTFSTNFADLPPTTTKSEAAEHAVRAVAKLYARHHGPDVPLGCYAAGGDIPHVGVVLHVSGDDCHVACEPESVAAALLESHSNPDTHLAARAEFVKTRVPPANCVHAESNTVLTAENCATLTPAHLLVHGDMFGKNPNVGIDEATATKIRGVIECAAQQRKDLRGASEAVLAAVAKEVGWH